MNIKHRLLTALTSTALVAGVFGSALTTPVYASVIGSNETGTNANGLVYDAYSTVSASAWIGAEGNMAINPAGKQIMNGDGLSSTSPLIIFSPAVIDSSNNINSYVPYVLIDAADMKDSSGGAINEAQNLWKATASGDVLVWIDPAAPDGTDGSSCSTTFADYGALKGFSAQADDNVLVCMIPKAESTSTTGSVAMTVSNNTDVSSVQTFYMDFYGPVSTITPTAYWSRLADDATDATQAELAFKDAAGVDLLAKGIDFQSVKDCAGGASKLCANTVEVEFYVNNAYEGENAATALTADEGRVVLLAQADGFCDEASATAGSAVSIYAFMNADGDAVRDTDEVKTAAWSVTCTNGMTDAKIGDVALAASTSKASTIGMFRTIDLIVSVEDKAKAALGYLGDGMVLSVDNTSLGLDYEVMLRSNGDPALIDPSSNLDLAQLVIIDGKAYESIVDGKKTAFTLTVGSSEYYGFNEITFSFADVTAGDAEDVKADFTLSYNVASRVVTLTAVTGKPKTVCATFGKGAAGVEISFLVEYVKDGIDKVVVKKSFAGLTGKACATMKGKNRTVTAFWGRQMSNTVLVK